MPSKFVGIDPKRKDVLVVPPDQIELIVNGPNVRWDLGDLDELCELIARQGQLEPGLARKDAQGRMVLMAGNRRKAAILRINEDPSAWLDGQGNPLTEPLPYRVLHIEATEEEALEITAAENTKRDLSPVDQAFACRNMRARGWDNKKIGKLLGIDQTRVSHLVRLMELPDRALRLIHSGRANEAFGRQLLGLTSEQIERAMDRIDTGEKPAAVIRSLRALHRQDGRRRPRTRKELASEWDRLTSAEDDAVSNFAVAVQKWIAGEPDAQPLDVIVREALGAPEVQG